MPPARRIIVDPDRILTGIFDHRAMEVATLKSLLKTAHWADQGIIASDLSRVKDGWIRYDLAVFSGNPNLTPSEKQRWREAVLQLEKDKLVDIAGIRATEVRLTRKGVARVRQLRKVVVK